MSENEPLTILLKDKLEEAIGMVAKSPTAEEREDLQLIDAEELAYDSDGQNVLDNQQDILEEEVVVDQSESVITIELSSAAPSTDDPKRHAPATEVTEVCPVRNEEEVARDFVAIKEQLHFIGTPWAEVRENEVRIFIRFWCPEDLIQKVDLFVHWGNYADLPERWVSVPAVQVELKRQEDGSWQLCKVLRVHRRGRYGATICAGAKGGKERIWQGRPEIDDAVFNVERDSNRFVRRLQNARGRCRSYMRSAVVDRLRGSHRLEQAVAGLKNMPPADQLSEMVFDITRNDEQLRGSLALLHHQAKLATIQSKTQKVQEVCDSKENADYVLRVLENLGLSEITLVAPEGPHAIAGGLAQVMNGLLHALSQAGVRVSLISPMYENDQGNKHSSAQELLKEGIPFFGERLPLEWAGEIDVSFGPTYHSGTPHWKDHPMKDHVPVYKAERGNVRIFLMRHTRFANCLYASGVPADEALRRSIFLSRGALEIIKNPIFRLHPQLILSNDWIAALVPVFAKLDLRYSCDENLKGVKTVHLLHNCGRDYHGLIPVHHNRTDLWPLLELAPEHYGSCVDPQNWNVINMTAAAIANLNGALLAVSKPYGEQLLTSDGGEGLHDLVSSKRGTIFGISNGIEQKELQGKVRAYGEYALHRLAEDPQPTDDESEEEYFLRMLPDYKRALKLKIQQDRGLNQREDSVLISFVGRLAEQKGVQLLRGNGAGENCSVMESILLRYPEVQLLVAGPMVEGDAAAAHFRAMVEYLSWKYRGRINGIYDFVPHDYAIEIFAASDLYLMPSRYEPGGITQLEALACGTAVVARNVGGLSATLHPYGDYSDTSNAFLFEHFSTTALRDVVCYALDELRANPQLLSALSIQAATAKHDWGHRVPQYVALFQHLLGVVGGAELYNFLEGKSKLLQMITV